jgi:TPR repeat protein
VCFSQLASTDAQLIESTQGDVRRAASIAIETCGDRARLSGNYVIAIVVAQSRDRGNASAQMKVANVYEEGRGSTSVEYTQAHKWYDIAGRDRWRKN